MSSSKQILFLPGAGGVRQYWEPLSQRLVSPARHVIVGWPGFDGLPRDPGINRLSDLAGLVQNHIDRPTDLIAQSMGGVVAMQVALKQSSLINHLVLVATSGGVDMQRYQPPQDWRPQYQKDLPQAPQWFVDDRTDLTDQLPLIKIPTLLIWGDNDPVSPVAIGEYLARELPNAKLIVVEDADHFLARDRVEEVTIYIAKFLSS